MSTIKANALSTADNQHQIDVAKLVQNDVDLSELKDAVDQSTTELENQLVALDNVAVKRTSSNGAAVIPSGSAAQRPSNPTQGMFRYNSDSKKFEGHVDTWDELSTIKDLNARTGTDGSLSFRNKIINGKMEIAQRGDSFPSVAHGAYTIDRWRTGYSTSAVTTVSKQADAPSNGEFQTSLQVSVTTADTSIAASDYYAILHFIEGYNVRDLVGKPFSISFWVRSSKTGVHSVALANVGADRTYVAEYVVNVANTWEAKKITVPAGLITAGTWDWTTGRGLGLHFILAAGNTFHTTQGAWQAGNFLATANQVNCLDTAGNIFAITGVQLEAGSVATPFEHRPVGVELALCQRYFWRGTPNAGHNVPPNYYANTFTPLAITFPETMRAVPTLSMNLTGWTFTNCYPTEFTLPSKDGGRFGVVVQAAANQGYWVTNNTGWLQADAEL